MKKFFFSILLFAVSCTPCLASGMDDIRVKAEVDKAFLTIGDPVIYTVTVEYGPDIRILSDIPEPSSDALEIKKVEDFQSKQKKMLITGRKFIFTSYRLGEFVLGPVTIKYRKEGQPEKGIQTNKLYLTVKSVAEGKPQEDIRDVKSVVPYALHIGKFLWVLIVLALLLVAYFLYRVFFKKAKDLQPGPLPLTAEEEAFLHLRELFDSDLFKRGLIKTYYLRLSEILRIYFEKRYKILAVELTTIEIMRALRPLRLEAGLYQKIQNVLEASDLAKFAKWVPSAPEIIQINKKAEEIITESVPLPEPAPAEASHGV